VFGIYSKPEAVRRQFSRRERVLGRIAALSCPAMVLLIQRPDWLPGWLALPVAAALAFGGAAWGQYVRNRPE
jgi:hypothetical protein